MKYVLAFCVALIACGVTQAQYQQRPQARPAIVLVRPSQQHHHGHHHYPHGVRFQFAPFTYGHAYPYHAPLYQAPAQVEPQVVIQSAPVITYDVPQTLAYPIFINGVKYVPALIDGKLIYVRPPQGR